MDNLVKQDRDKLKLFKRYGYDIPRARKFILTKAKISKGRILEVGTGRGHMALALAGKGFKLTSIDLDRQAQFFAKANFKAAKLEKSVILKQMNAEKLLYRDNSFDYVVSVNFVHHAENPVKCLKEMVRVADNKLVIADVNKRGEKIMEKVHALNGHRHAASRMPIIEVRKYLEKVGLTVKIYRDVCQTVIIAEKKPVLYVSPVFTTVKGAVK
jgi:ubiquinone/menaquinone biosynthesis C-methylase UbiE